MSRDENCTCGHSEFAHKGIPDGFCRYCICEDYRPESEYRFSAEERKEFHATVKVKGKKRRQP